MREVHLPVHLVDTESEGISIHRVIRITGIVAIMVVASGEDPRETIREDMPPFHRGVGVLVGIPLIRVKAETVVAIVAIQIEVVPLVELMVNRGVQVVKTGVAILIAALLGEFLQDPVRVSGTSAHDKGGLLGEERPLQGKAAGQQADARRSLELLLVTLPAVDVEHGGDTSAILGGDAALVQLHVLHHVGVEDGEEAEQVGRVIDRAVVEEDQVLVRRPAPHVKAARGLAHRLHAGKRHDYLHDIHLAERHRDILYILHLQAFHSHRRIPHVGDLLGGDRDLLQGVDLFLQLYIQLAVGIKHDLPPGVFHAHALDVQLVPSGREAQRIIAVSVGSGPDHRVLHEHGHAHHRLAGLEIADIAGHRDPVRRLARGVADLVDLVLRGSLLLLPARHQGDTGAFLVAIALSPLLPQEEVLGQGGHQGVISQYKEGAAIRGYLEGSPLQRTPQRHQGLFLLTVYANDHGVRLQGLPVDGLSGLPLDSVEHDIQGYLPEIQIDRPLRPRRPTGQQAHHHNDI